MLTLLHKEDKENVSISEPISTKKIKTLTDVNVILSYSNSLDKTRTILNVDIFLFIKL